MAVQIGTAIDYLDLWDKLLAFLTSDPTLVANGEAWEIAWQAPAGAPNESDLVLKGPGSTGTEEIFVGLRRESYPTLNSFFIRMVGMTGVIPTASTYDDHLNVSRSVVTYLDQNPMKYWFVANGRRFAMVVKISTVYEAMYGGLFLPFADPLSYPYPLMVGGSAGQNVSSASNWTNTLNGHSHFVQPWGSEGNASNYSHYSSLHFLDPSVQWLEVDNGDRGASWPPIAIAPWKWLTGMGANMNIARPNSFLAMSDNTIECLGGGFALHPATLIQNDPADQTWGVLDGAYWVPGNNNAAENIVTVDGVDHLVIQNVFRTSPDRYWALALE